MIVYVLNIWEGQQFLICMLIWLQQAKEVMEMTEGILKEKCGTKELLPSQYKRYREVQIPDGQCLKFLF